MMRFITYSCASLTLLFIAAIQISCSEGSGSGNNAPTLTYLGLDQDTMTQAISGQGVAAFLTFEDLDGDISGGNEAFNISLIDNRDGSVDIVSFPILPDIGEAQRGDIKLDILTTCCIYPVSDPCTIDSLIKVNQYTYDIFITDDAGNKSNSVTTDIVTLLCN